MTPTKVKELDNLKEGDRNSCPICNPNPKRVREDQVWGVCPTNRTHKASDHFVATALEEAHGKLNRVRDAYEVSKTGNPSDEREQFDNLLELASSLRAILDEGNPE